MEMFVFILVVVGIGWGFTILAARENNSQIEKIDSNLVSEKPDIQSDKKSGTFETPRGKSGTASDKITELEARVERLLAAGREIIVQRDLAERERDAAQNEASTIKRQLDTLRSERSAPGGDDARFRAVKAAFARLYHPDRTQVAGIERMIREEFFKEFWAEIERIEKAK